ncbi:phage protein NinX family protein [Pectobacterium brasiliense]|uniref:phage protein NinX family protein n=1 Tax=Pectobacterium brasiliense TaxID=180957 RepID=UPI00234F4893|nr:phage protein NinX family protein [Pectobacterium carotovorum]
MKVKTSELSGKALDWAVAKATREEMPSVPQWILWDDYHPTKNWRHCGPLLEKHRVSVSDCDVEWVASIMNADGSDYAGLEKGSSAPIAISRAVVASLLGDEIELPEGLANGLD